MILRLFLCIFSVCITSLAANLDAPEYQIHASYIDHDGKRYTSSFNVHGMHVSVCPPKGSKDPPQLLLAKYFFKNVLANPTTPDYAPCITCVLKTALSGIFFWTEGRITKYAEQAPLSIDMIQQTLPDTIEWRIMPRCVFKDGVDGPAFLLLGPEGGTLVGRDKPST